jgi:tetratricopeptide (TPR) repeat protein
LAIRERFYGPDDPDVAQSLNNLALLLKATNRLGEAEPLFRRALAIDEQRYGPDHPSVATALNNLAGLLRDTNRPAEAEPLHRRALAIDERSYGPDHPSVATALNNLAILLRATNRLGEAEPLFRRALAIDERSYGPDHPTVARDLNNLGVLLQAMNRWSEAEPLYRRALAIAQTTLGPDHPDVVRSRSNLMGITQTQGKQAEVVKFFQRAGCELIHSSPDVLTISGARYPLVNYTPVLIRLCLHRAPERSVVSGLAQEAKRDGQNAVAFLVYSDPPKASARAEFPAAWSECRVSIVPLELHAIENRLALGDDQCWGLLDGALKTYGPGADLFYSTGQISDSLAFFGRQGLLTQIRNDLLRNQAVGLFGLRKVGKTSVLNHLAASLDDFLVIKLDLEGRDPVSYGTRIFNDILSYLGRLLKARGLDFERPTPIEESLPSAVTAPMFRERIRAIIARLGSAIALPLMIFLDEVERILPGPDDSHEKVHEFNALFGVLRALNQEERCLSLLIADLHADSNRINYWTQGVGPTNPVFSFFKEVYLGPFELVETRDMLNGIGQLMGYTFDDSLIESIHSEAGGYPVLSRQIASTLTVGLSGSSQLTLDNRNRKMLGDLFNLSAFFRTYCKRSIWEDMRDKGPRAASDILRILACTNRPVPLAPLTQRLSHIHVEAEIQEGIVSLRDYGLIMEDQTAEHEGYCIVPKLFARWLPTTMTGGERGQWTV